MPMLVRSSCVSNQAVETTMADEGLGPVLDRVRATLRAEVSYSVPHPPGIRIKLDANEHPFSLPAPLRADLARHLAEVDLNRYPDAEHGELRAVLAARIGASADTLLVGNGSDELIGILVGCLSEPREGRTVAAIAYPVPSFTVFRGAALAAGCETVDIPTDPDRDFAIDIDKARTILAARRPNLVFFARPNNPTGTLWPSSLVTSLADEFPDVVFVSDEAYSAYATDSMLGRWPELPNLLVMQTLSKIGLAALRVGYIHGHPRLMGELDKVRMPYNVGTLNQRAALWVLRNHAALLDQRCQDVVDERSTLLRTLEALDGIRPYSSSANLILFRVGTPGDGRASKVWQSLCQQGILIRNFDKPGPLSGCLRVTIGTAEENQQFTAALERALAQ